MTPEIFRDLMISLLREGQQKKKQHTNDENKQKGLLYLGLVPFMNYARHCGQRLLKIRTRSDEVLRGGVGQGGQEQKGRGCVVGHASYRLRHREVCVWRYVKARRQSQSLSGKGGFITNPKRGHSQ